MGLLGRPESLNRDELSIDRLIDLFYTHEIPITCFIENLHIDPVESFLDPKNLSVRTSASLPVHRSWLASMQVTSRAQEQSEWEQPGLVHYIIRDEMRGGDSY